MTVLRRTGSFEMSVARGAQVISASASASASASFGDDGTSVDFQLSGACHWLEYCTSNERPTKGSGLLGVNVQHRRMLLRSTASVVSTVHIPENRVKLDATTMACASDAQMRTAVKSGQFASSLRRRRRRAGRAGRAARGARCWNGLVLVTVTQPYETCASTPGRALDCHRRTQISACAVLA
jgi:hypothetical protein